MLHLKVIYHWADIYTIYSEYGLRECGNIAFKKMQFGQRVMGMTLSLCVREFVFE
jgi:hypothetical protein